jgi:hypothetical protein
MRRRYVLQPIRPHVSFLLLRAVPHPSAIPPNSPFRHSGHEIPFIICSSSAHDSDGQKLRRYHANSDAERMLEHAWPHQRIAICCRDLFFGDLARGLSVSDQIKARG